MANHGDTTKLFQQAFGNPEKKELPRSTRETGWRVSKSKKHGLSFGDLFDLQALMDEGARWDDRRLQYYLENGQIVLTDEAKKEDKRLTEATGFDSRQRSDLLNIAQIEAEIIADLLKNPAMSAVVGTELQKFAERFGDEGLEMVKQDPEAAAVLHRRSREAELAAKAEAESNLDVSKEIQQAQEQIAAMNAAKPASDMSREELQAALLKLDAAQRGQEQGE